MYHHVSRFSKACAWRPWETIVLELHQVRQDIVWTLLMSDFLGVDQFCELQPLPVPPIFSCIFRWGGLFSPWFFQVFFRNPSWQNTDILGGEWLGNTSLSSTRTGGAIPLTSESRHDILRAELVISIFPNGWKVEKAFILSIYSSGKRSTV